MDKNDFMLPLVIGVTGHRDISIEDHVKINEKIEDIFKYLKNKYPVTPFILLSPLADGADRLVAKIALEKYSDKITTICPIPFDEQTYKNTFGFSEDGLMTKQDSIQEFDELINKINSQTSDYYPNIIPMIFDKDEYDRANDDQKRKIRHKQYSLVGEYVAIHSHILIALEDVCYEQKNGNGGTSEIVEKKISGEYQFFKNPNDITQPELGLVYRINIHRQKNETRKTLNQEFKIKKIFPGNKKVNWENEDKSVSLSYKDVKENLWFQPCVKISQSEAWNTFRNQHNKLECLNKEILEYKVEIEKEIKNDYDKFDSLDLINENCTNDIDNVLLMKNIALRRSIAHISRIYQSKMQKFEKWILFFIILTTSLITLKSNFDESIQNIITYSYPVIIAVFYILAIKFKQCKTLHEDSRAISEGFRVQTAWNMAKINESVALNYLSRQKDEMTWIRTTLRTIKIFDIPKMCDRLSSELKNKIDTYWIQEQIDYFTKDINKKEPIEEKYSNNIKYLAITFTVLTTSIGINSYFMYLNADNIILKGFDLFISVIVIVLSGLKAKQVFNGYQEILNQYEISLDAFKRAQTILKRDNVDSQQVYINLGREALYENTYWTLLRRKKNYKTPPL